MHLKWHIRHEWVSQSPYMRWIGYIFERRPTCPILSYSLREFAWHSLKTDIQTDACSNWQCLLLMNLPDITVRLRGSLLHISHLGAPVTESQQLQKRAHTKSRREVALYSNLIWLISNFVSCVLSTKHRRSSIRSFVKLLFWPVCLSFSGSADPDTCISKCVTP